MKTFLFIFLTGYAVRCDDNYYVIRMPDSSQSRDFKVYWNVPTMQCKSKKITFDDLFEEYGIIQNTGDTHRGDKISILYDPGNFPALIKNGSTGEIRYRNGGVPQEGSLIDHLQNFKKEMEKSIPDKNFSGFGIIDFESWRPILRQNFGSLTPYKDVSYDIEKRRHFWWKKQWVEEEARRRFDSAGREFMQTTLSFAKKMRPKALWGYYGYPQCFNRPFNSRPEECAEAIPAENNDISWLWIESTALFPSVYSAKDVTAERLAAFIRGRIKEAERVGMKGAPILPYWWFRYRDGDYFKMEDLKTSFNTFYNSNASGFIIWGSSKDVNTKAKCMKLRKYVTDILGPTVAKYTKVTRKFNDVQNESDPILFKPETVTEFDPDYHWEPPENYTSNIEHIVDEELKNKKEEKPDTDGNVLIDVLLNKFNIFCVTNCGSNDSVSTVAPAVLTTKDPFEGISVQANTTARTPIEQTTGNHESFSNDDIDAVATVQTNDTAVRDAANTSVEVESNEYSTVFESDSTPVLESDINTTDLITSIEIYTDNPSDLESSEDTSITNLIFNNSFDETSTYSIDNERTSTIPSTQETSTNAINYNLVSTNIPKLNLNDTSFTNFNVTTIAPNFSSNNNSTENYSLDSVITTNVILNDTSPMNDSSTEVTASRPSVINWRDFYMNLLNLSAFAKDEFGTVDGSGVAGTTAAPELTDQVVVSVV